MSACTDLINAINAVVLPPNFNDLAPSCATLTLSTNSEALVQLSGGGNAVLSAPSSSIDGRVMTVTAAGKVSSATGSDPTFIGSLYLGSTIGSNQIVAVTPNFSGTTSSAIFFFVQAQIMWDSTSQKLVFLTSGAGTSSPSTASWNANNYGNSSGPLSASSYSDVAFSFSGKFNNISGTATLTMTQFSLSFS